MNSLLATQMICAFAPALIGLAVAAVTSPRMFRLVAKAFRFDLTSAMLLMAAFAMLFAANRTMRDLAEQAHRDHLREQAELRGLYNDPNFEYYGGSQHQYDYQIATLTLTSIFTVPGLIFLRIMIDSYRDESRKRAERQQRKLEPDALAALEPKPVPPDPPKPQWID